MTSNFEVKYQHLSVLLKSHEEDKESEEKDNFLPNHKSELLVRENQGRSPMILNRTVVGGIKKLVDAQLQTELKKRATIDRKSKRLEKNSENDFSVHLWWDKSCWVILRQNLCFAFVLMSFFKLAKFVIRKHFFALKNLKNWNTKTPFNVMHISFGLWVKI